MCSGTRREPLPPEPVSTRAARSASFGVSKRTWSGRSIPNSRLSLLTRATACRELPPEAKNSSWVETSSYFSIRPHSAASHRSVAVAGATYSAAARFATTSGSAAVALASIFPLAVSGSSFTTTTRAGIM